MTVELLKEVEATPSDVPDLTSIQYLSATANDLDWHAVWLRIEAYISHRWTPREVVWTVAGPGDFEPPLSPFVVSSTERWTGTAWEAETLNSSPCGGFQLLGAGPCRFTATVGEVSPSTVPADVAEAFRRLAEYMTERTYIQGASRYSKNLGGELVTEFERNPAWLARALQYSGAADSLRKYRRLK